MKVAKIAKNIVMAPAYVCVIAGFGAEEIIAKTIARATGSQIANECGIVSEGMRNAAIDCMIGKEL